MRTIKDNIKSIRTAMRIYTIGKGQYFCETPKSFEIWSENEYLPRRILRIDKRKVYFVEENQ